MPILKRADAEIHYEIHGAGFPILLYAPGGLKSEASMWGGSSPAYPNGFPWMDPRKALSDKYTVIAMDQRNAGRSVADVKPDHGWHTFAADHLALMDHLGFKKFHVMGGCAPLYLQPGTDKPHPAHTSAEIAELAPNIEVQKDWRGPEFLQESIRRVHTFLARNTPKS